jgi:trehalose 6-phosphate synthase
MTRLVAVSNRVEPPRGAPLAGGLTVALVDALAAHHGLWFGWSGQIAPEAGPPRVEPGAEFDLATIDLTQQEHADYYNGFANRCLWPLHHFRLDLALYDRREFEAYRRVNARFAASLAPLLREGDLVWVHDYHLFCLGAELRRAGATQRIGYFLHIPFPPHELMATLPCHQELARALFDYDLVGLQTQGDVERFCTWLERHAGARCVDGVVHAFGRSLSVGAFPVGIDAGRFRAFAEGGRGRREFERSRTALAGRDQIIGVDRLDYSKGLLRRFAAYEQMLEKHSDVHGRVELLQIAPVSRGEVKAYRDFRRELEQKAAQINGHYGRIDWTPVRYINRPVPRKALAGLHRASRVGLVTPMRDGMNLVAKEYVAAQDPDDPGVLVLSRFAGAAQQMTAAMLVNPYDATEVADALYRARSMSLDERRHRHAALVANVFGEDVTRWREDYLNTLQTQDEPTMNGAANSPLHARDASGNLAAKGIPTRT